jgi:hypothetical protein
MCMIFASVRVVDKGILWTMGDLSEDYRMWISNGDDRA